MSKSQLRRQMADILSSMIEDEKRAQSMMIFQKMISHPRYKSCKKLSIYLSNESEVDTISILRHALEVDHKQCYIPLVRKTNVRRENGVRTRMIMYQLTSMDEYHEMPVNSYGIKEPIEPIDNNRIAAPRAKGSLDLVVVPGVAFSRDGHRCGHGMGYYDEFLTDWLKRTRKSVYCIGLAFKQQLVEDTRSIEGQDYVVDEVMTAW